MGNIHMPSAVVTTQSQLGHAKIDSTDLPYDFALLELLTDPIFVYDRRGEVVFWNQSATLTYGWSATDALGQRTDALFGQADVTTDASVASALDEGRHWRGEVLRKVNDGKAIIVDCQRIVLAREAGAPVLVMDLSRDRSMFQQQENRLKDTARILQAVMDNTSSYIHVRDVSGRFLYVNGEYEKVFRVNRAQVIGKLIEEVFPPQIAAIRRQMHETVIRSPVDLHAEIVEVVNCRLCTFMDVKSPLFDDGGKVYAIYCIGTDITERKALESRMLRLAHYDVVTELPNRFLFHERLKESLGKLPLCGESIALLFLDLDGFKDINDTLGHDAGDRLLSAVGMRLQASVRHCDMVARVGGDEFTVILDNIRSAMAVEVAAQNLLGAFACPFQLDGKEVFITASIGITISPQDASESNALFRNADNAMYAAKRCGPGGYRFYTESMNQATSARFRITTDLKRALREGQFQLVYQPIVSLCDGAIHKAEALIRWEHPEHGTINPVDFIPIAENTGDIVAIGEWVFREAVRQCVQWRQEWHPNFQISINTSPVQYRNGGLDLQAWSACLAEVGLAGDGIVVEITEGLLMDVTGSVQQQLRSCSEAGMEIALDDFGTGYSSLSYLRKFDVDYLKIDRSFITNLAEQPDDRVLCEAIIAMAHKLGLRVIAEGIETVQQRDMLIAAGCDYGQGYLFSKPVPASAFKTACPGPLLGAGCIDVPQTVNVPVREAPYDGWSQRTP